MLYQIDDGFNAAGFNLEVEGQRPHQGSNDYLVGSFGPGANQRDEILWLYSCYGDVWRGDGDHGFETHLIDVLYAFGGCDLEQRIPLLGDFNGDNIGDIFWYGPGDRPDRLSLLHGTLWETSYSYWIDSIDESVDGLYAPLVGDFNGDFISDIFWYRSGPDPDFVWLFEDDGSHSSLALNVIGDFSPIVGRFNLDGCDDILLHDPVQAVIYALRSDCDGTFTEVASIAAPANAYPVGYGIGR